jgi:UDP-N-acetylglucosamine--N-acetylmuramyl-(pentapeptide) pyrophosphoryl-undecaprenol N-acetylglucosamine transferase
VAELMAAGRPSILVPLPTATDDHQRKNAEAVVARGAARLLEQRDLTGERLAADIAALAVDPGGRRRMGEAARALARPDAARAIVEKVIAIAR